MPDFLDELDRLMGFEFTVRTSKLSDGRWWCLCIGPMGGTTEGEADTQVEAIRQAVRAVMKLLLTAPGDTGDG